MFALVTHKRYDFLTFHLGFVFMAKSLSCMKTRLKKEFNFLHTLLSRLIFVAFLHANIFALGKNKLHCFLTQQMLMLRLAFVWTGVRTVGHGLDTRFLAVHTERYITGAHGLYRD